MAESSFMVQHYLAPQCRCRLRQTLTPKGKHIISLKRNLGHYIWYFVRYPKSYNQFRGIRIPEERWSDCGQPSAALEPYDHEWFLNFPGAQEVGGSCGPFYVLHFGNLLLNSVTDDPLPPQSFTTSLSLDSLFYPCCPCQVTWLSFLTGLAFAQWLTRSRVFFWSQFQLSFHLHRTCERRCPSYLAPPLPHACCIQRWCECVTGYAHFWYVVSFAMCCINLETLYPFLQMPACSTGPYASSSHPPSKPNAYTTVITSAYSFQCLFISASMLDVHCFTFVKLLSMIKLAAQGRSGSYT